jgi:phage terminase large subunit-like protein
MSNKEIADEYANRVINGSIVACKYVKLAAQRYLNDLADDRYYFNEPEVNTVIAFLNTLYLTEQSSKEHFILQPWQTFIVCNIYGIYIKSSDNRKYKNAYLELARKQGKSFLINGLAIYHLIFDADAEVVVSANSREQAKNTDFKKCKQFASQLDKKQKRIKHYYNSLKYKENNLIVTASEASRLDGLNISFAVIDELAQAPDNKMYNVIQTSQGSRRSPLCIAITTAGYNTESFCYQMRTYVADVLQDIIEDNSLFGIIYTLDDGDSYEDKNNWIKANPNIDVSIYCDYLESQVNRAVNSDAERNGILVKNMNVWLKNNTEEEWIPEKYVVDSMQKITMDDEKFYDVDCWVGVDLSSVSDLTAVNYMIQLDDKLYFFVEYYVPEDSVNTNINKDMFRNAAANGYLHITSGNVADYDRILEDIIKVNQRHSIQLVSYDRWNSTQFAINATAADLILQPYSQTAGSLNKPIKEFQRLLLSGNIVLQKNILTKWCIDNVIIKQNHMGNLSIDKSSRNKKIDGVAAMLNTLGAYLDSPRYSFNVY